MQTALDIHQQSILRRSGPFVKPCSSLAGVKLYKDKGISCAIASSNNIAKKKRSKGSGRKTLGLPPCTPLPPVQHRAASTSGPAAQERRGLQKSKSGAGKHPKSSFWEMHRMNPPSTPAQKTVRSTCLGDTCKRLREEHQFPPRPSPRAPDPGTREEWDIQGAAGLPVTTRGQTRARSPLPVWVLPGLHL